MDNVFHPQELVVLSGKGGTGKTSVVATLAQCISNKVLVDADVDAANLHLLIPPLSGKTHPFIGGHVARIDPEKCHACGACATQCRFDAIHPHAGVYQIDPLSCEGCKRCVQTCRFGAILWEERNCGTWLESSTRQGTLFHARLDPGAENSGKLVSLVREKARERAIQEKIPVILMDGPPGIGCPAIASLTGVHYALLVTEPTPAGHHDLMRILELVKHFQVHASLLLNKADLDDRYRQKIQEAMAENHVPIVGEIPFSPLFSEAQFHGQSIIEAFPDAEESQHLRAAIKNWLRIISESQHQRSIS